MNSNITGKGFVPAGIVTLGDFVRIGQVGIMESARVICIRHEERKGAIAPITVEGTIVVDGVAASCYAVLQHNALFHLAMAPARFLYYISTRTANWAHGAVSWRLKGSHIFIDVLSFLAPVVRLFHI
mmetsp:Transcript_45443/g.145019  ORF Transcript_45443/g.145019 Transcript_45443/m.145019 type:complete len:127 (+) Transcript_45443:3-383(+)